MFISLHDKKFAVVANETGLSNSETIFHYFVENRTIYGNYSGGHIQKGSFVGKYLSDDTITLLFQCITEDNHLLSGESTGKITSEDKLKLTFQWNWLSGDSGSGESSYLEL